MKCSYYYLPWFMPSLWLLTLFTLVLLVIISVQQASLEIKMSNIPEELLAERLLVQFTAAVSDVALLQNSSELQDCVGKCIHVMRLIFYVQPVDHLFIHAFLFITK